MRLALRHLPPAWRCRRAALVQSLESLAQGVRDELTAESKRILDNWNSLQEDYAGDELVTKVRDKELRTLFKVLLI